MPIYEYECSGGDKHRFEKWQSMKDDAIKECPECGSSVRKILHPAGIIFKGSGWYITDSRKSGGGESKESDKADKKDTKSESGETKSDAKSETKSEGKSEAKSDSTKSSESKSGASSE